MSELLDVHHIAPPWCIMQVPLEIKNLMHVPQTVRSILEVTAGAINRGLSHACWEALWLQLTPWDLINLHENPLSAATLQQLDVLVNKTNSTRTPAPGGVSIYWGVDCKRCSGLGVPNWPNRVRFFGKSQLPIWVQEWKIERWHQKVPFRLQESFFLQGFHEFLKNGGVPPFQEKKNFLHLYGNK